MSRLSDRDVQAIRGLAGRLRVDPASLGGLMELESGIDPNIWGGAGGQYRGLIQFGPGARKEVGLPDRPMTIEEQIPYVEKYFNQRGFKPGEHGATELYRTVLVGNPHSSGTDSFGTSSDSAAKRMLPGGDLYERAAKRLGGGGPATGGTAAGAPATARRFPAAGGGDSGPSPAVDGGGMDYQSQVVKALLDTAPLQIQAPRPLDAAAMASPIAITPVASGMAATPEVLQPAMTQPVSSMDEMTTRRPLRFAGDALLGLGNPLIRALGLA